MQQDFNKTNIYYTRKNKNNKSFKLSAILLILAIILLGVSAPSFSKTENNYIAVEQNDQTFALRQKKWQT